MNEDVEGRETHLKLGNCHRTEALENFWKKGCRGGISAKTA